MLVLNKIVFLRCVCHTHFERTQRKHFNTMENTIEIRVLEHDTEDQIRIGQKITIINTINARDSFAKAVMDAYQQKFKYFGGFHTAAPKNFKKLALVNADTFETILVLYSKKEEEIL